MDGMFALIPSYSLTNFVERAGLVVPDRYRQYLPVCSKN